MQIQLYNQLYKSNEMVALLSEPEHIAERRRDLTELIRVMRNAQKVIRRDPDLMTVMKIDINDSDIHPGAKDEKNEPNKLSNTINIPANNLNKNMTQQNQISNTNKPNPSNVPPNKKFGNLFGEKK